MSPRAFAILWAAAGLQLAAMLSASPASAWDGPWADKPFWERGERSALNAGKGKAKNFGWGSIGDDEDEPVAPKAKKSASATPKPGKKGPAQIEGGPRPNIAPKAPETVAFSTAHAPGSIVIDTAGRKLYYVRESGKAYRYPIAVGKVGFTWTGVEHIARKQAWPDWNPPAEMRQRKPELPEHMSGGVNNPLGAMALYLGNSLYRIHGTSDPNSIGTASSSGCFRMHNAHVVHLASLANVGTKVTVVKSLGSSSKLADASK